MNILFIEDDDNKRSQVVQFLNEHRPPVRVTVARSLQSGIRTVKTDRPDLVLLDMTLPTFDIGPDEGGGSTHAFGGREFLRQLKRFGIVVPVIVITQFETFGSGPGATTLAALDKELRREYPTVYRGSIYYHAAIQSWKDQLQDLMKTKDGEN